YSLGAHRRAGACKVAPPYAVLVVHRLEPVVPPFVPDVLEIPEVLCQRLWAWEERVGRCRRARGAAQAALYAVGELDYPVELLRLHQVRPCGRVLLRLVSVPNQMRRQAH